MTFANGKKGGDGGAIDNEGTLIVANSTFSDNDAHGIDANGGCEAIFNDGTLTVTSSTFTDNQASGGGENVGGTPCSIAATAC